jgi:hypothetical protein
VDLNVLMAAVTTGALAAHLGQRRVARDRADVRAGKKTPAAAAAGPAAVSLALGAMGLALTAVVALVQHEAAPPASALFVILLAVGVWGLARARRHADHTDDAEYVVHRTKVRDDNARPREDRRSLALVTLVGGPAATVVLAGALSAVGRPEASFWVWLAVGFAAGTYASVRGVRGAEVWAWGLGTFAISMISLLAGDAAVAALLH